MKYNNFNNMQRIKYLVIIGLSVILAGCGNSADSVSVEPMPSTSVEADSAVEDPEISEPVIDDSAEVPVEEQIDDRLADATLIQTGENKYAMYIDCPDNSDAPEIAATLSNDNEWRIAADSELYGISENLLIAVLTHGMQIDSTNPAEISFEAWENVRFDGNAKSIGNMWGMLISNPAEYDIHVYSQANLTHNVNEPLEPDIRDACGLLLQDCITETNGNITCGLARYNVGPDVWNQLMQECMDATGLTADEIYANYDANYVYQNDTLGLGNPNYSNEVLEYVNGDIIITSINPIDGKAGLSTTYSIERVKTYGSIQP